MEKKDLFKVCSFAKAIWSSFKVPEKDLDLIVLKETWYLTLAPYPVELVLTAMQQYAKESDFCNVAKIGAICERYMEMQTKKFVDKEKTIANIRRAIGGLGTYQERFDELTDFEKEIVGSPNRLASWGMTNIELFETVIVSNLRKVIDYKLENKKFEETLANIRHIDFTRKNLLEGEIK